MTTTPKGITAVLIDPQGHVVASAVDFNRGGSAGVTQEEAQRYRVERALAVEYVTASCNGYLAAVLRDGYPGAEGIVQKLVACHGFRSHIIPVGYPSAE